MLSDDLTFCVITGQDAMSLGYVGLNPDIIHDLLKDIPGSLRMIHDVRHHETLSRIVMEKLTAMQMAGKLPEGMQYKSPPTPMQAGGANLRIWAQQAAHQAAQLAAHQAAQLAAHQAAQAAQYAAMMAAMMTTQQATFMPTMLPVMTGLTPSPTPIPTGSILKPVATNPWPANRQKMK